MNSEECSFVPTENQQPLRVPIKEEESLLINTMPFLQPFESGPLPKIQETSTDSFPLKKKKIRKSGISYKKKPVSLREKKQNRIRRDIQTKIKFDQVSRVMNKLTKKFRFVLSRKIKKETEVKRMLAQRSNPYIFVCLKILKEENLGDEFASLLIKEMSARYQRENTMKKKDPYFLEYLKQTNNILLDAISTFLKENEFQGIAIAYESKPRTSPSRTNCSTNLKKFQDCYLDIFSHYDNKSIDE